MRSEMVVKQIPEWQYPLYHDWDRDYYKMIERLAKTKDRPKILGSQKDIDAFLKTMIRAQKMKDWRTFFKIIEVYLTKDVFNIREINNKILRLEIPKGIESWAIFDSDKRICILNDEIGRQDITFIGSKNDIFELILRFIASQFTLGWQVPLMAMLLDVKGRKTVRIKKLNNLLRMWDYTNIFE